MSAIVNALRVIIDEGSPGKMKRVTDRVDRTKRAKYSDIKIRANFPPIYSILNPETNSDSPSAISKGVRLASARQVVSQIIIKGGINKIIGNPFA